MPASTSASAASSAASPAPATAASGSSPSSAAATPDIASYQDQIAVLKAKLAKRETEYQQLLAWRSSATETIARMTDEKKRWSMNAIFGSDSDQARAFSQSYKLLLRYISVRLFVKRFRFTRFLVSMHHAMTRIITMIAKQEQIMGQQHGGKGIHSSHLTPQTESDAWLLRGTRLRETHTHMRTFPMDSHMFHLLDAEPVIRMALEHSLARQQALTTSAASLADRNAELTQELTYYRQQVTNMQSSATPYKIPLYAQSEHIQTQHLATAKAAMRSTATATSLASPTSPRKADHAISLATQLHQAKVEIDEWKTRCANLANRTCTCVCVNGCEQRASNNSTSKPPTEETFAHPLQPVNPYGPLLSPLSPPSLSSASSSSSSSILSWGNSQRIPLATYNAQLYGTGSSSSHAPHVIVQTQPSYEQKEKKKSSRKPATPEMVTAVEKQQIKEMGSLFSSLSAAARAHRDALSHSVTNRTYSMSSRTHDATHERLDVETKHIHVRSHHVLSKEDEEKEPVTRTCTHAPKSRDSADQGPRHKHQPTVVMVTPAATTTTTTTSASAPSHTRRVAGHHRHKDPSTTVLAPVSPFRASSLSLLSSSSPRRTVNSARSPPSTSASTSAALHALSTSSSSSSSSPRPATVNPSSTLVYPPYPYPLPPATSTSTSTSSSSSSSTSPPSTSASASVSNVHSNR